MIQEDTESIYTPRGVIIPFLVVTKRSEYAGTGGGHRPARAWGGGEAKHSRAAPSNRPGAGRAAA